MSRTVEERREAHRIAQLKWRVKNRARVAANHRKWVAANRVHVNRYARKQYYKVKYGMSAEDRDALLAAQKHLCAACSSSEPGNKAGWVIDHCHKAGSVRGILCHHCNLALGNVKDSVSTLLKLVGYLERARG